MSNSIPRKLSWHAAQLEPSPLCKQCFLRPFRVAKAFIRNISRTGAAMASTMQQASTDKEEHNRRQAEVFTKKTEQFLKPLPADIHERLQRIVNVVPDLGPSSRVMDVGSGTGCLVPCMQQRGVQDILAVDLAEDMLTKASEQFGTSSSLGNDPGFRTWVGDVESVPAYQGPFDAAFLNAVFGNVFDQRETLLRTALLLRPGGHIVISHPLGRAWHEVLRAGDAELVPHAFPDTPTLQQLIAGLPLRMRSFQDDKDLYLAVLQVPPAYLIQGRPLELEGEVVAGCGRGSSKMGVPTANIAPGPLAAKLEGLPLGVYFGWAQLDAAPGQPEEDSAVHKMAMNIGRRPSIEDGTDITVEVHILHSFAAADFRGQQLRVIVGGFIRPEMRFGSLDELIARIKADVGIAKAQLDLPEHQLCKAHEMFVR
ncbi:hypothetical protein WJX75_003231 [Coccomyxa subellipsoidea]|uniref:riboflavin kinase n=1 Tax=Coccomyxa subellipsoidea TaxID=248742 RepID=A0ABR2YRS3_9CHLO